MWSRRVSAVVTRRPESWSGRTRGKGGERVALVLGVALVLVACLYPLTDLLFHHLQYGALHGSDRSPRVALTFDDGPSAETPEVLAELGRLDVRATFFMVAERAREHPEWVRQVVEAGHEVALHGLIHRSSYLYSPWGAARALFVAKRDLEAVAGRSVRFYRPPWGHHNLGTWWASRRLGLTRVLWTIAPDDWRPDRRPERIAGHVEWLTQPGGIIVLHDGGGDRSRTVASLAPMVASLRRRGLEPAPVGDLAVEPSWGKSAWAWWETRFTQWWEIEDVPAQSGGRPILRVGRSSYPGPPLATPAGRVPKGAAMAEIHFGNPVLAQFSDAAVRSLRAYHAVIRGLYDLADFLSQHPKYAEVEVIGGVTLLDAAHAIERLGFRRVVISGWLKWSQWVYLMVLMTIYHRRGWRNLFRLGRLRPVLLVIDRETLFARYGSGRPKGSERAGAEGAVMHGTQGPKTHPGSP